MSKHRDNLFNAIENKKMEIETAEEELKEMEIELAGSQGEYIIKKAEVNIIDGLTGEQSLEKEIKYLKDYIAEIKFDYVVETELLKSKNKDLGKKLILKKKYIQNIKYDFDKLIKLMED